MKSLQQLMLCALLVVFGSAMAHAQENTVTWLASSGDALQTVLVGNDITLTWVEGAGDMAPKYSGGYVYFYNGNRVVVAGASDEIKIKEIVFTFKDETKVGLSTCNSSGKNVSNVGISNDNASMTTTWEGEANSVIFRASQGTGVRWIESIEITYEGSAAPVVRAPALVITQDNIADSYDMDANSVFVVYYENQGNLAAENAKLTLYVDGSENASKAIGTLNFGSNTMNFWNAKYNLENITAGEHQVYLSMTADNAETVNTEAKTVTFTKKAVEATFAVAAENVNVEYGAESYQLVATVTNTSENVAVEGVQVLLQKNMQDVVEPKYIDLAAGESQQVIFTVPGPFTTAGESKLWVLVKAYDKTQAQTEVVVTFEEAPVIPVVDINLIDIRGLENINLSAERNIVMVTFQNNSNVDVENATITLTMNGIQVGEPQTIGKGDFSKQFTLPTEGLVAGETAMLVATLNAENNKEGNTVQVTKELAVISGETEPAAEIAINPISSWEVEAGEQEIAVAVVVYNNGNADAEGVKIQLYKNYTDILSEQTIDIPAAGGEEANYKMLTLKFNYTFEQGNEYEFTVFTGFQDAVASNNEQRFVLSCPTPMADLVVNRIADINATTEDNVIVNAVLKNNSSINATDVKVGIYTQGEDFQYQLVGFQKSVEAIAAGQTAEVEFNLGQLLAGTYKYYVRITSPDSNPENNIQDVKVTVTEPVVPVVNVALTAIQGLSNIDIAAESNTISVWVKNDGNVDAEATITVQLNDTELPAQTITVRAAGNAYAAFTLPVEGLTVGGKAIVVARVAVADNISEDVSLTRDYDIVDSSVATDPVFEVAAENVSVAYGSTSFEINAVIKNISTVDATNVEVKLLKGIESVETKAIAALAAGTETVVTFTVEATEDAPFVAGQSTIYYVQVPKAQAEVVVAFEEEPVVPAVNVALTAIQGLSNIDIAAESNTISVWVKNDGNADAEATITVQLNDTELPAQTITVRAAGNAYAAFTLPVEGLVAGGKATVVARVAVVDNTSEDVTLTREYDIVDSSVATDPVFEVAAENVSVAYGATSFEINAVVKNISTVDATDVDVKLLKGIESVETKTIAALAAGAETIVTFTVEATEDAPFVAGQSATYYVQAPKAQAEILVSFQEQEVEKVVDLAVTTVSGRLSAETENNYLTVFVDNMGTVDVTEATVKLTAGDVVLGTATVSAKAGSNGFCSIAIPATSLQAEVLEVTATVEVQNDVNVENNTLTKSFEIAMPDPQVEIIVADVTIGPDMTHFVIPVKVKNLRENYAAKNVKVMIYDAIKLMGQATVETIAAGAEVTVNVNVEVETAYTATTALKAWATGYSELQLVAFSIIFDPNGINDVMQMRQNERVYTLDGLKVNDTNKAGIYVINGRKVLMK